MGRLFWKFFLAFWLALLVASLGVGTAVWLHQQALATSGQELAGGGRAAFLVSAAANVFRHGGRPALRDFLDESRALQAGAHVYVVDEAGQELLGRTVPLDLLAQARTLAQADREPRIARLERVADHDYLFFLPADGHEPLHHMPLALPIGIGILASLAFSAWLAWYLSTPMRHLRGAFDAAAAGSLDTRIGPQMGRRRDEIADLGRDFDRMAGQLQALVSSQRRLLHDVSHELRSPLARLEAAIGLARQRPGQLDDTLDRIEREAVRLDQLVGELLTLSRMQAGMARAADEAVDLVELLRAVADDARFEAQASGREVRFVGEGEALVNANVELLHRALENVVRNAVKFTGEGSAVEVEITRQPDHSRLLVTVSDRGPGVPEGELQAIFEPFFRSETRAKTAGFGLGLAIARRAIETHGGTIRARNRPGGGLQVEIVLPVAASG
ncbi:ATP-binding protein [uncultured Thiodictyon sp.]|uniref:ATP-binding protein n=1 Tax=uncultured Thiodictyon sp. TaxID=1846217 RepID=UPI0025E4C517|nr:ATP-binding protein [uncultured Thiodictyon sp.]